MKSVTAIKVPKPKFGKFRDVSKGLPFKKSDEKPRKIRWL